VNEHDTGKGSQILCTKLDAKKGSQICFSKKISFSFSFSDSGKGGQYVLLSLINRASELDARKKARFFALSATPEKEAQSQICFSKK
jgi:hypothetical protein